ncbi:MAG: hypothetical protein ABEJ65_03615, partial [bacterium]
PDSSSSHPNTPNKYALTEDLAESLGIFEGQILRTTVHTLLPEEDKIILNLKDKRVVAQSSLEVEPGDSLIVEVKSITRPIELKLMEPENTEEELSDQTIENHLREMEFSPEEELVETARNLLEHELPLNKDLVEKAHSLRHKLFDERVSNKKGKTRALKF